jgi:hypothetical protein
MLPGAGLGTHDVPIALSTMEEEDRHRELTIPTFLHAVSLGAVNAIHDAVVLANALYNMPDSTLESITAAFQEYYNQRYHRLDAQLKRSKALSAMMGGKVKKEASESPTMANILNSRWANDLDLPHFLCLPINTRPGSNG